MGATLSRLPGGTPDARTVKELDVIEELIRTDLGAAQRGPEQYMPMQVHGNDVVEESSEVPSPTTPDRKTAVDAADAQEPSMMADAAPNEAFQRYQQSAAAAAADQGTTEPAFSQATPPEGGSKGQRMDCEGTGLVNSYRSRKRKEKEAASQAASHKSNLGKRLRRELEMLHDHAPEISADASGPCGSASKRHKATAGTPLQKTKMRAFTPGKKNSKPKSADWEYMASMLGPDLTDADVSQDDWVRCPDGRSYPKSMTYKEDDILVDEYLGKVEDDQLYTVAYIIDERRQGNKREFRVKWEGFEMNPEEWIPYMLVKDVAELDKWEERVGLAQ